MKSNSLDEVLSPLAGILNQEVAKPERNKAQTASIDKLLIENICGLLSKETLTGLEVSLLDTLLAHYKSFKEVA